MAASGGNKKISSQSDKNYWQRAKASSYHETHKAKRINRHVSAIMRAEKTTSPNRRKELATLADTMPEFPKLREKRVVERVVDRSNIPEGILRQHLGGIDRDGVPFEGKPLYQGYIAGVLVESSFHQTTVIEALGNSRLERHHYCQHPTGRRELIAFYPQN